MRDRFGPARTAGPDGMSDVERLLAYEEIRQLAARYALAVDGRDVGALTGRRTRLGRMKSCPAGLPARWATLGCAGEHSSVV